MSPFGLTSTEAQARLEADGPNVIPSAKAPTLFVEIVITLKEPMLLLLLAAGTISFFLAEFIEALVLMLGVLFIVGISLFQQHKTQQALFALRELSSPRALVIRDGIELVVPSESLVRGDLIILREGDRISADARLETATNFQVDESMLTGESLAIVKTGGDEIFSGSLVQAGHGSAVVEKTGAATQMGNIGKEIADIKIDRTRLQEEIDKIIRFMASASIVSTLVVMVVYGLTRNNWGEAALAGLAAAMSLLPEEIPVVLTVFLALGALHLSQQRVITRRFPVIETLGAVTVLCVDKTGTITMNQMSIQNSSEEACLYGLLASPVQPFDPMDKAFHAVSQRDSSWNLVREYPMSDSCLAVTQVWEVPGKPRVIATKGAPETVAKLCGFDKDELDHLLMEVDVAANKGFRVLAVAKGTTDLKDDLPNSVSSFSFSFIGLVYLVDPVRPDVATSVRQLTSAGVRTIMLTGDYPGTASAIAREVGISNPDLVILGQEMANLTDQQLSEKIKEVSVFARVAPSQKLRIIRALKANGHVVGMTGDGINDAPALRAADIGIAMGMRGTDVARESAALVITDDDFTTIAGGIRQGRKIYANLRKAISYVIAVHVPIFGLALFPVFVGSWPLVLLPIQIAFLELIIDPASSVVFEREGEDPRSMDKKPRRISDRILNRKVVFASLLQGLFVLLSCLGIYLWSISLGHSDDHVRSITFATLMIGNLLLVLTNRSQSLTILQVLITRKNKSVKWLLLATATLLYLFFNVPWLQEAFNVTSLTPFDWLAAFAAAVVAILWFEIFKLLRSRRTARERID